MQDDALTLQPEICGLLAKYKYTFYWRLQERTHYLVAETHDGSGPDLVVARVTLGRGKRRFLVRLNAGNNRRWESEPVIARFASLEEAQRYAEVVCRMP